MVGFADPVAPSTPEGPKNPGDSEKSEHPEEPATPSSTPGTPALEEKKSAPTEAEIQASIEKAEEVAIAADIAES